MTHPSSPEAAREARVRPEILAGRCSRILEHVGMSPEDSHLVADSLVLAELRGVRSHGFVRLPVYVERIRRGVLDPRAELRIVRQAKATATLDACDGHGIPAGVRAMDRCIEMAKEHGVAAVTVRRSNHFGMAWYFIKRAVEQGMIGVAASNADAFVAPWGAGRRYLGTNPLAIGIPAGQEPPVVLDMATSAVAHGRILLAKQRDQRIPLGWALDGQGEPTTDPAAALEGALLPFGEAKGSAISLVIDLVCGPLAGALTGPFIAPLFTGLDRPQRLGHFFTALDVAAFGDPAEFARQVDDSIRAVRALAPAKGFERVYLPGEPEWLNEQHNRAHGVELDPVVERQLVELERTLGV